MSDDPLLRQPLIVMWRGEERKLVHTDAEVDRLIAEGFVVKDAAYWQSLQEAMEEAKRKILKEDSE